MFTDLKAVKCDLSPYFSLSVSEYNLIPILKIEHTLTLTFYSSLKDLLRTYRTYYSFKICTKN